MVQTKLNHIPEALLSMIPKDPYEQLDLAHKITSIAIASHVSKLESDVEHMKQQLNEKDQVICKLEEKTAWLERAYREADLRFKSTNDENIRLSIERDSLSSTVKRLTHDVTKLDTLKKQLLHSLVNDDNNSSSINAAEETFNNVIGSTANSSATSCSVSPRINGKDFFRQARNRLSREQFTTFLANINARRQTREETLKKAEEIFGTHNRDLYLFHALLNRNADV